MESSDLGFIKSQNSLLIIFNFQITFYTDFPFFFVKMKTITCTFFTIVNDPIVVRKSATSHFKADVVSFLMRGSRIL